MARSFHRKKSLTPLAELNVTNLIDLGFSLLIIFMISTPLIHQERSIPVDLPISSNAQQKPGKVVFKDIVIVPGGYVADGVKMNRSQLEDLLKNYGVMANAPVISIKADRNIPYQQVVSLLDLLKQNNLSKINLDTQQAR